MANQTPIEFLAHKIIVQACEDYRLALRRDDKINKAEIEQFFHSTWYTVLSPSVNGEYLIYELQKEYENEQNRQN